MVYNYKSLNVYKFGVHVCFDSIKTKKRGTITQGKIKERKYSRIGCLLLGLRILSIRFLNSDVTAVSNAERYNW